MKTLALTLFACFSLGWVAQSAPVKLTLPGDAASLKPGLGADLAVASCLTCHSAEYINFQPSLTRTAWKASVDKMKGKFGAPIPDDAVEKLVDYLTANYGKADK